MIAAFARLRGFEEAVEVGMDATGSVLEASEWLEASLKLQKLLTSAWRAFMQNGKEEDGKDNGKIVRDKPILRAGIINFASINNASTINVA